ncbi:MAG TPA: ABC-ATPase domain-containing protein [Methanoregula sp.]|nr:ABC-ATPase domain-containing protein [Methanoregula sp.]
MADDGPGTCLSWMLSLPGDDRWGIDTARAVPGVTAYAVRSFDGSALRFSLPVVVRRPVFTENALVKQGFEGAVALVIEYIKKQVASVPALSPLAGRGTRFPRQCASTIEPYTLVSSPAALASDLWHADNRNFADSCGFHLLLWGAVPCPSVFCNDDISRITETVARLCDAVSASVFSLPARVLRFAWINALDQQKLREDLPSLGLVSFIGDGAKPARHCTQYRCFFRTAGPKTGVSVPFVCPRELEPVEVELAASNEIVTGLGIKQREVFAVAGSNAQGKTTFLEGIISGMDDHAAGDGRERIVTVHGLRSAEAMNCELAGVDVSMFFSALPPGVDGTVKAAFGTGSGSMTMAHQVQRAIVQGAPLLVIDEDRAAPNLLVKSCLQAGEITPLSEILARDREKMGETALVFAACAMDTLIAQADRILLLDQHAAFAIDRMVFRQRLAESLEKIAEEIREQECSEVKKETNVAGAGITR